MERGGMINMALMIDVLLVLNENLGFNILLVKVLLQIHTGMNPNTCTEDHIKATMKK